MPAARLVTRADREGNMARARSLRKRWRGARRRSGSRTREHGVRVRIHMMQHGKSHVDACTTERCATHQWLTYPRAWGVYAHPDEAT